VCVFGGRGRIVRKAKRTGWATTKEESSLTPPQYFAESVSKAVKGTL
jgi:hypothetical protein